MPGWGWHGAREDQPFCLGPVRGLPRHCVALALPCLASLAFLVGAGSVPPARLTKSSFGIVQKPV